MSDTLNILLTISSSGMITDREMIREVTNRLLNLHYSEMKLRREDAVYACIPKFLHNCLDLDLEASENICVHELLSLIRYAGTIRQPNHMCFNNTENWPYRPEQDLANTMIECRVFCNLLLQSKPITIIKAFLCISYKAFCEYTYSLFPQKDRLRRDRIHPVMPQNVPINDKTTIEQFLRSVINELSKPWNPYLPLETFIHRNCDNFDLLRTFLMNGLLAVRKHPSDPADLLFRLRNPENDPDFLTVDPSDEKDLPF